MKILLVVDLQKQFRDRSGKYEKCLQYIESHRDKYDKVIAILFQQDRSVNGNYAKLKYTGCMDADISDIEFSTDQIIVRHGYGLPLGVFGRDEITVMGCGADTGVLAVCFSLWDDGIDFRVLKDYIYAANVPMDVLMKI